MTLNIQPGTSALNTAAICNFMHKHRADLPPQYAKAAEVALEATRHPLARANREDFFAVMCMLELYARYLLGRLGETEIT